ncbi:tetratricopeptide repeat protein [uncultured Microbacterium sp.]|uniref:tetratricopeptide repeat protein n=1 Tax=uncultured Microbacterium sp. TaxID=191216 RepID=UPI0025D0899F|nr:tetratricopeptide repeat protein [uncultured Microbacterium sp.]
MTELSAAALRGAVDLSSLRNRPAASDQPATGGSSPLIVQVTDATFPQILELSQTVPIVVDLAASWSGPSTQLTPVLEKVVLGLAGRVVLAEVDVDANPQLAQGFRAQSIPMVVALVAGQPVPLFNGALPEEQIREVLGQLLELASQHGVTGTVPVEDAEETATEPVERELPPLHQAAFDAIEAGDYAAAISAYEKALAENPRDEDARAGLGQVRLLNRTQGLDLQEVRAAAAAAPTDVDAQFAVADLDVAGGHVDDAFARLLDLFAVVPPEEKGRVRERLVELFGLVGDADPRVGAARKRLAALLF